MGRHGGINILHQKSWHVWRLDNRLTVERDELRHAEEERQKKAASEQAVFSTKLKQLRQKASIGTNETDFAIDDACHQASTSSSKVSAPIEETQAQKPISSKEVASFKYGMVTTSNLKKAEIHLDSILGRDKGQGKGKGKAKGKVKAGEVVRRDCSLGSGPHINLFEEAEQEQKQHLDEHQKQLGYTHRNNELVGKSKKALFSEFDEIASDIPWYMRSCKLVQSDFGIDDSSLSKKEQASSMKSLTDACLRERSRSRSGLRRKWKEGHGQGILQVKHRRVHTSLEPLAQADDELGIKCHKKEKKDGKADKKDKKEKKKDKKDKKKEDDRQELLLLRKMREDREARERARASSIMGLQLECV